jgi:hypothetical protein
MTLTDSIRYIIDNMDRFRPDLEAAMEHNGGTHTFDDLTAMVLQGRLRLWATDKSIALTEIIEYPRQKHYHVFAAGGDLDDIVATIPQVEQAARDAGCCKLTISGRRGWVRALAEHGWTEQFTTCVRSIEP